MDFMQHAKVCQSVKDWNWIWAYMSIKLSVYSADGVQATSVHIGFHAQCVVRCSLLWSTRGCTKQNIQWRSPRLLLDECHRPNKHTCCLLNAAEDVMYSWLLKRQKRRKRRWSWPSLFTQRDITVGRLVVLWDRCVTLIIKCILQLVIC